VRVVSWVRKVSVWIGGYRKLAILLMQPRSTFSIMLACIWVDRWIQEIDYFVGCSLDLLLV
jgi:hypothetical protein